MKNHNKPWDKGFVERQFRCVIVSIDYDPSPYYGDCKKCGWKAGEHVTAFFKTQRPWRKSRRISAASGALYFWNLCAPTSGGFQGEL